LPSELSSPPSAGTALPPPPDAQGEYQPAVATEGLIMTAGMTPRVHGALQHVGQVGAAVSLEDARVAAGIAVSNAVAAMVELLGSVDRIGQALRMTVYVNAVHGFADHSKVADGASTRLCELLGERGTAVRSAVGVSSLPGEACVEVELTCSR
jgi:enamine deaminase RidA (YjgF/YER057c/UK114 family)